jgi:hypothetical protein
MTARVTAGILLLCAATMVCPPASADSVQAGRDYFHTIGDTWFDFGPGIGIVPLEGASIDPAHLFNTDTIVERKQDADLPDQAGSATIEIEMVELSLRSVDPVLVTGPDSFFDVLLRLDLGPDRLPDTGDETPSLGQMTIRHEISWPDDGMNTPEGTFDSFFDIFADALFVPVGGTDVAFIIDIDNLRLSSFDTCWTHSHDLVPPLPGASNFLLSDCPLPPEYDCGFIREEHPGVGVHEAENTTPEPLTLVGVALGVGGLAQYVLKRRAGVRR